MAASRRILAKTFVEELLRAQTSAEKSRINRSLAAYIIETKQRKYTDMLLGDITKELAARGHVAARVSTAAPLDSSQRELVMRMVKDTTDAKTVELLEEVEPSIIGGIRLSVPGYELDASIKRRLTQLQF